METMTAEQLEEAVNRTDLEKLRAESLALDIKLKRMFAEIGEEQKKTGEKLDKLWATVKRVTKNVGGLNNSMGSLIETLIGSGICGKFKDLGLERVFRQVPIYDDNNRLLTDIDLLLSNTIRGMGVEIKKELNKIEDVDMHLKRMELIRKHPPAEIKINNKELLGAMAGGMVDPDVLNYAHSKGLYVLELSGESVRLMPTPKGFTPKVW
jgi:hypothetical protein